MNFLIDMNLPPSWADFLTGAGFTAVHWSDEGPPNATDRDLAAWIAARGYVLVTSDTEAAAFGGEARAIVVGAGDLTPEVAGGSVLEAIHRLKAVRGGIAAGQAP